MTVAASEALGISSAAKQVGPPASLVSDLAGLLANALIPFPGVEKAFILVLEILPLIFF